MRRFFLVWTAAALSFFSLHAEDSAIDSLKGFYLQEVEVISVRANAQTPMAYSNQTKQEIEAFNFGQDTPFLLTLTPSVIVTSDAGTGVGYTGFRVRGTDANRINITANGIPLNDSESHGVYWVNMPDFASSLQDLQIQRGVGASTNGAGAFGASINMKTEAIPMEAYSELDGGYGSFNTAKATLKAGTGVLHNHWAFDGRLSSITSDGFIDRASADLKSYFAQGAYFNENTLVKLITFGGKEKTYHAWDGVPDYILSDPLIPGRRTYNPCGYMGDDSNGNPLYYADQTDNYQQRHYQLSWIQKLHPDWNLNVALHYTRGLGYYEEYKLNRKLKEYGFSPEETGASKSDLIRQKHLDNDFGGMIFSLNYNKNRWNAALGGGANQYDGRHFGKVIWVKEIGNTDDHEFYRSKSKKTDATIYLKGNYQATKQLNLYGDAQYRFIDYRMDGQNSKWDSQANAMQILDAHPVFHFFNPKAGALFQINRANQVYGSVAVAHREPNRNNYTDAVNSEQPQAERLTDFELGYKFQHGIVSATLNAYVMNYKNQLVLNGKVNDIGEPLTSNVPDSYRRGIEVQLGLHISENWKWDGNATWSHNRIKNYTEYVSVYAGDDWHLETGQQADNYETTPISFSPEWIAGSLLSFRKGAFNAALQSLYVAKQYLDNTGSDKRSLDPYFVNNVRIGYDFQVKGMKGFSVNLLINNLFNEEYESNGWTGSYYYRHPDGSLERYTDQAYFPQAGTNIWTNIVLKF
ncbi:MAG: TonB-dependent receptor [Dysgonamonadaceae bacterium]|jgi:iron complex outermembrane receptor protein|nr:TonB-dependent receptor [Dysgonamonadaceae bacterium]